MAARSGAAHNPLVINSRPDTSLSVQLHPLVLLTVSDYITRHTLRQQSGLIVGAVIGQQTGRNFTLEHAFELKLADGADDTVLDGEWFRERLEMYKEVHKEPALDLVALFMLGPADGPQQAHLPILKKAQEITSSDNTMLLLFHPEQVDNLQGGKLPISLYESLEEIENDEVQVRFKELAFEVETGDAEMIGVNFVAVGGGNATAVTKSDGSALAGASSSKDKKAKGKGKAKEKESEEGEANGTSTANNLSPEDDELISTLNSKVNAIKMLNERLDLIRSYLETLPTNYLTDSTSSEAAPEGTNFTLLRSINSMLSRLPILAPPQSSSPEPSADVAAEISALQTAADKERQDVHLTSLLASLTRSVAEVQSLGCRFGILQREKQSKERIPLGGRGARDRMTLGDEGILADSGGF